MRLRPALRASAYPKPLPRDRVAAAVRCLILLTVFAMARFREAPHSTAFEAVVGVGAVWVLLTTLFPWNWSDRRRAAIVMLAADIILITALIFTQDGIHSDYYLLYYLPVLHASVRLNFRDAIGTCALAAASYLLVGMLEGMDRQVTFPVMSRVLTFTISAGLLAGFFLLLSREQRAYQKLSHHYQQALQAKTEFLSRVSHEFRTPLTAIVGFSQLLYEHENEVDAARQHEYLSVIRQQAQHLARMIEDMLDVSRIDEGRLVLHRGPVSLSDAIESALMLLDHPQERQRVEVFVDPQTPAAWVDRNEIEQAVARILYNVLALSEEGASVGVRVGPGVDEESIQVTVRAPGLDPDDERLATLFAPASGRITERPSGGNSLGLAVARALIELHGGALWLDETSPSELAICFTLPKYRAGATGPEVILGADGRAQLAGAERAEAHGEGDGSGRRSVGAEAHAGESVSIRS